MRNSLSPSFPVLQSPFSLSLFRILGLSASIVTSHCNIVQFREKKEKLEAKLDSHVVTTENLASLLQ